jgi:hypothetical protein
MCHSETSALTDEFSEITAHGHYSDELRRPSHRADDRLAVWLLVLFVAIGVFTWTSVFIGFDPVEHIQTALVPPVEDDLAERENVLIICGIGYINSQQDFLVFFISLLAVTVILARSSLRRHGGCD